MSEDNSNVRQALRDWIRSKAKTADAATINDQTLIIEEGLITSVDVLELFLLIEELGDIQIDATELQPDMLESIDQICQTFFE
jgi:acyl carrier protein